ncbi:MAG: hypothetical protein MUO76_08855 [Anaerolineaceae bacterium]|nr:hypothetical protein [Anaerolineaceae bacterium]
MATAQQSQETQKTQKPKPEVPVLQEGAATASAVAIPYRLANLPPPLMRDNILALQRFAGNFFVQRMIEAHILQRQGGGSGSEVPIPALPEATAREELAVKILKDAYGGLIKKETKVVNVDDASQLRTYYDQTMMRLDKKFRESDDNLRDWKEGDATIHPNTSNEFYGYNDPHANKVYIDTSRDPDEQVATLVHEMLHNNSATDFVAVMGYDVDEGMTEMLTKEAFTKSGYTAPTGTYGDQVTYMTKMGEIFGANTLKMAYFKGTAILRSMMDKLAGEGVFDKFILNANDKNYKWLWGFLDQQAKYMNTSEINKKKSIISALLSSWFVFDDDITNVENVYLGSTPEEQAELKMIIRSAIGSLSGHGHRARLRALIG